MKSRKRRYIQNTSEDDSDKENDELEIKRYFSTLMSVLSIFDREDLNAVYQLVMDKYQDEIPQGFNRVLWGDLMVMFNPDNENEFWNSQLDWIIVSWKLHSSYAGRKEVSFEKGSTDANAEIEVRV
ncbi:hypothetical protein Tco_1286813 [Tanacetum coccineum]